VGAPAIGSAKGLDRSPGLGRSAPLPRRAPPPLWETSRAANRMSRSGAANRTLGF